MVYNSNIVLKKLSRYRLRPSQLAKALQYTIKFYAVDKRLQTLRSQKRLHIPISAEQLTKAQIYLITPAYTQLKKGSNIPPGSTELSRAPICYQSQHSVQFSAVSVDVHLYVLRK
jgi:hypothetical protein